MRNGANANKIKKSNKNTNSIKTEQTDSTLLFFILADEYYYYYYDLQ